MQCRGRQTPMPLKTNADSLQEVQGTKGEPTLEHIGDMICGKTRHKKQEAAYSRSPTLLPSLPAQSASKDYREATTQPYKRLKYCMKWADVCNMHNYM